MTDDALENDTTIIEGLDNNTAHLEQLSESILNNDNTVAIPSIIVEPKLVVDLEQSNSFGLEEFDINSTLNSLETITLKKPNQVYYEIYKEARRKAKKAKREAIVAFLEAKNIKKTYMLDDFDESDSGSEDSNLDNMSDEDDENEDQEELNL